MGSEEASQIHILNLKFQTYKAYLDQELFYAYTKRALLDLKNEFCTSYCEKLSTVITLIYNVDNLIYLKIFLNS